MVSQRSSPILVAMKRTKLFITFLSSAAFVIGCNKEATTSEQLDKAQAKTEQTAQEIKDYSYVQKSEFVEKMRVQLTALNADLDQLSTKIEKSSDAIKAEAKPKLQALRDQAAELNKQLDGVKDATESTWDSVKAGVNKAYTSSKNGFQEARLWVSEKIAP
jgi:cytochrome c556